MVAMNLFHGFERFLQWNTVADCGKMATRMSNCETSIKVVTFSGKKKDWLMWLGGEVPCQGQS
jgi:hypothetical protein